MENLNQQRILVTNRSPFADIFTNESQKIVAECLIQKKQDMVDYARKKCMVCEEYFVGDDLQKHQEWCKENYNAKNALQNQNYLCQFCGFKFRRRQVQKHQLQCQKFPVACTFCQESMPRSKLPNHQENLCKKAEQYVKRAKARNLPFRVTCASNEFTNFTCIWCQEIQSIQSKYFAIHLQQCKARAQIVRSVQSYNLTPLQQRALFQMYKSSATGHLLNKPNVKKIALELNYTLDDLVLMSKFIEKKAPLIIHIKLGEIISSLNKDSTYRSLFETNTSNGTKSTESRDKWEKNLFGNLYKGCQNHQRVKYGVINYANDLFGVNKCRGYGDSIILLKDQIRQRCTICDYRKYKTGETVVTLKYHNAVLALFTPDQLRVLYLASKGFEVDTKQLEKFKEIHVHGSICMFRDVKYIVTTAKERAANIDEVNLFETRFGVKILTYEDMRNDKKILN